MTDRNPTEQLEGVRRALARAFSRVTWPYLAAGTLVVAAVALLGADVAKHEAVVEAWLQQRQPGSLFVFMAIFILATSLLVPESVLSIVAGALFGLTSGILVVTASSLLAAALQYALARRLLHDRIERALARNPSLQAIRTAVAGDELRLQFLLRLTPLNPAIVSYVLGAAAVRFRGFALASLASLPHSVLEVWFGHAGRHVARLAGSRSHAVEGHDLVTFGGLVLFVIVMTVIARKARRALLDAASAARPVAGATNDR